MGLNWFTDLGNVLPFAAMVTTILLQVSSMVVSKVALSEGMDKYVMAVYSHVLSTLILFPCSIIFHRSASSRPPLTFDVFCGLVFLALVGSLGQICEYFGMQYSSPTLGTAMLNLAPAFTFIFTLILRLEKLDWRSFSSEAKVAGTIVSIAGAFVMTFYKGPAMMKDKALSLNQKSDWILGGFFLAIEALLFAAQYIMQALILKKYPAMVLIMFYIVSFGTIVSTIISLILVKDSSAWRLRLDMGLVTIVYGTVVGLLRFVLCLWCVGKAGPLYVSMFKPLAIIFGAVMSIVFLGDVLCLGSVIGAVIIAAGFYAFMWGKTKEKESLESENGVESLASSREKVPLLQNKIGDV